VTIALVAAGIGGLLDGPWWAILAGVLAALALVWHLSGSSGFPLDRSGVQANRAWAMSTRGGRVYFGYLLGLGLATHLTTPLVYALLALAAAGGWQVALALGVGFGLGRSLLALAGAVLVDRMGDPGDLSTRIITAGMLDRWVGAAGALAVVGVAIAAV
jgi:hypothetical protein